MKKYSHNYNVILDNMDLNEYRLSPISAIMYLQDAFARLCATKKVAAFDLFPYNLYWVVGEFNVEFTSELPFWSEEIRTDIWISEMTKLKIFTDFELYYKDKLFAKGNGCWFVLEQQSKRPAKTDFLADKLLICPEFAIGEHKKFCINEAKEKVSEIKHKNNLSDLDFNHHVNNKSYMNIAEASMSEEYKKTHMLKTLNVRFIRESYLDDTLACSTYKTDISDTFIHKIMKDDTSVCDIQTSWAEKTSTDVIQNYNLALKSEN